MNSKWESNIPKSFWRYYDQYRRSKITLSEFSMSSGLSVVSLNLYLRMIKDEIDKGVREKGRAL